MSRWLGALALVVVSGCRCDGGLQAVRPQLSAPVSPIDFGTIPVLNQKRLEVPLLNVGRARLVVSPAQLAKNDGIFTIESAPTGVEGGATENLVLVFAPRAEQAYEETLTFTTDDLENETVTLTLTGVGSTRAIIEVEPSSLDFGRVAECGSTVALLTVRSAGTADLVINSIAFTEPTSSAFSFVGSTRTPAVIETVDANGLPGEIQITVRLAIPAGTSGTLEGAIRLTTTDPERQEVLVPLTATVNRAPIASIEPLGNAAPGQTVTLDGGASMDLDGDLPLTYRWSLRSKPLTSSTTIEQPTQGITQMRLDPSLPGAYEVQLEVTDSTGAKSCQPARATVVAAPAQKILVEMFWDNPGTDLDLHVLRNPTGTLFQPQDDCFYQSRTPDWGMTGDPLDDPELVRDALTGYGPEVFGYVNPVDGTYRIASVFENDLLSPMPSSTVTVRVYIFGVLKAELQKTLTREKEIWSVADVVWPSGDVRAIQ